MLASGAYLARLNNPTLWTARMMPHYLNMRRGLCGVVGSFGPGHGGVVWRHSCCSLLHPPGPRRFGAGSCTRHCGVDFAIVVTGYDAAGVAAAAKGLAESWLPDHGALEVEHALYGSGHTLAAVDLDA